MTALPASIIDLGCQADVATFASLMRKYQATEWQRRVMRPPGGQKQRLLVVNRQGGKSYVAATIATHTAVYQPGSLTLVVAPAMRQAQLIFRQVMAFIRMLQPVQELVEDNKLSAELTNG